MGFSIGSVFKNLMALATMNPAIIAATIGRQIASQLGQQLIQALGEQLGLPQAVIDMAQGAFASSVGDTQGAQQNFAEASQGVQGMLNDFFETFNVSPMDRGNIERAAGGLEDLLNSLGLDFLEEMKAKKKDKGEGGPALASDSIEGGFLFELAEALGKVLDGKMEDMKTLAEDMNDTSNKDQSKLGSLGAKIQAVGQEMKILSNALDNAVKSSGESQSTLARKG